MIKSRLQSNSRLVGRSWLRPITKQPDGISPFQSSAWWDSDQTLYGIFTKQKLQNNEKTYSMTRQHLRAKNLKQQKHRKQMFD